MGGDIWNDVVFSQVRFDVDRAHDILTDIDNERPVKELAAAREYLRGVEKSLEELIEKYRKKHGMD